MANMIDNDKMWASFLKHMFNRPGNMLPTFIKEALEEQGLQYNSKTKSIEEIDNSSKITAGKWYMCFNNKCSSGILSYTQGKLYQSQKDNYLPNDCGDELLWTSDAAEYFRPATEEEIEKCMY